MFPVRSSSVQSSGSALERSVSGPLSASSPHASRSGTARGRRAGAPLSGPDAPARDGSRPSVLPGEAVVTTRALAGWTSAWTASVCPPRSREPPASSYVRSPFSVAANRRLRAGLSTIRSRWPVSPTRRHVSLRARGGSLRARTRRPVSTVTCLCVCLAGRAATFSVLALQYPPPVSDARCVPPGGRMEASVGPICVMSWRGRTLAAHCRRRSTGGLTAAELGCSMRRTTSGWAAGPAARAARPTAAVYMPRRLSQLSMNAVLAAPGRSIVL